MSFHPLTNVHPSAKVGQGTVIEPFATIYENVEIGENCWIGPNAVIFPGARIGNNVRIFPGASISAVPQDLKFDGEDTTVEIGDHTTIRECVTISRGTKDKFTTKIGKNCLLMAYVHVAHDCEIGDNAVIANSVQIAGHVQIGYHVTIGGASAILQFTHVGDHVMVAGGSMVRKDIPPFTLAANYPISYTGVNIIGLRRRGFTNDQISDIQDAYRTIYMSGMNASEAIRHMEALDNVSEARHNIINFVKKAPHGIMKGPDLSTSKE